MKSTRLVICGVLLVSLSACSNSPTAPTPTYPNAAGTYTGTYTVSNCVADTVALLGLCASFAPGTTLPIGMTVAQNQGTLTGTVTLGSLTGNFQGTLSTSGAISLTSTLPDIASNGVTVSSNISAWQTTLNGNNQAGSFTLQFRANVAAGTATVTSTIAQLSR